METYAQIKDLDWSLVSTSGNTSNWANRLWPMEKHYQWLGASGGYGVGYGAPASVGAALGNRDLGRFSVSIQSDGDLMYAPGVLWTAARHKIPLLAVMHNNRGYHQEVMHIQRLSNFRNRVANIGNDLAPIGTSIMNPDIEYHQLAKSMGWWAKGPITDPADLGPAIKEAVAVVKSGQPALVNVVDAAALRRSVMRFGSSFASRRQLPRSAFSSLGVGRAQAAMAARRRRARRLSSSMAAGSATASHGEGSIATSNGRVIARTALPLDAFKSFVRTTNGAMPPFRPPVLSDSDLDDIYAYLQSLPQPKAASDIPLLKRGVAVTGLLACSVSTRCRERDVPRLRAPIVIGAVRRRCRKHADRQTAEHGGDST